ncbi:SagB/ThcOx family dehydrogenase [Parazoarcus communis]|uniref:SagB/ThcOx family dehydrogenase n=1 Tax=Parazoarcus communis TaxID=41977 RepID=UPI0019002076|nr:SagB/ThcOx family dehydrogenase [Parazoarcus communis]
MKRTDSAIPASPPTQSDSDVVRLYHARSKHRFEAYAAGPAMLDWDAQPAPFRHYDGAPIVALPLLGEPGAAAPLRALLDKPFPCAGAPRCPQKPGLESIGMLLHLSLGITAWKVMGPDRWAVRANPSSGNLHPVEAWLIARDIPGLADGVYHYRPEDHVLECRALDRTTASDAPLLGLALSTAMWREAWKYGERGFRYCQLDVGHAASALAHAAALLGWSLAEQPVPTACLAHRLGLDRDADFPGSRHPQVEREEAELLLAVGLDGHGPAPATQALQPPADDTLWFGRASQLDPLPRYRWPLIDDVAAATRHRAEGTAPATVAVAPPWQPSAQLAGFDSSAARTMLSRRSAQRFDASHRMSRAAFHSVLHVLGDSMRPSSLWPHASGMVAALFVHRVDACAPGLYLLTADGCDDAGAFATSGEHVETIGDGLTLRLHRKLEQVELHRLARSLHCHQDIASNACLALGLISPFDDVIAADPAAYRDLFRVAGQTGQALYLLAELLGLRGTGIGCFFDDPVHEALGLSGSSHQTLYHFTIGLPIDDARIESAPAYPADRALHQPANRTPT